MVGYEKWMGLSEEEQRLFQSLSNEGSVQHYKMDSQGSRCTHEALDGLACKGLASVRASGSMVWADITHAGFMVAKLIKEVIHGH